MRGIVLSAEKSSTYKLALLCVVARITKYAPAAATPAPNGRDAVEVPLGLVALNWLRIYLPLGRAGLPQMPGNVATERLGFANDGFEALLALGTAAIELRVGALFTGGQAAALTSPLSLAASTIANMSATFTRYPNSDPQVFRVTRRRRGGASETVLDQCVWTGRSLKPNTFDMDHCLPWSVWPCGDLWNPMPAHTRVNQHEKGDRLPSATATANARDRVIGWWDAAYIDDEALRPWFLREAAAALPLSDSENGAAVYDALVWRHLRLG